MIARLLEDTITKRLFEGKAIIIMGARQVGKTTLLQNLVKNKENVRWLYADEQDVQALFANPSSTQLKKE
ncbi:hypothetical protein MNBD_BACTEROID06-1356, partial [hydrothermal vent metagenome]